MDGFLIKKSPQIEGLFSCIRILKKVGYIIPPPYGFGAGGASFFGISVTMLSVVKTIEAIDAAFSTRLLLP